MSNKIIPINQNENRDDFYYIEENPKKTYSLSIIKSSLEILELNLKIKLIH